jgi:hypothetical protein
MQFNKLYKLHEYYFEKSDSTTIPVYVDRKTYLRNKPLYKRFYSNSVLLEIKPNILRKIDKDFLLFKYVLFDGIRFYIHSVHLNEI